MSSLGLKPAQIKIKKIKNALKIWNQLLPLSAIGFGWIYLKMKQEK